MTGKSVPFFVYYADNYATYQIVYGCPVDKGVPSSKREFCFFASYYYYYKTKF